MAHYPDPGCLDVNDNMEAFARSLDLAEDEAERDGCVAPDDVSQACDDAITRGARRMSDPSAIERTVLSRR